MTVKKIIKTHLSAPDSLVRSFPIGQLADPGVGAELVVGLDGLSFDGGMMYCNGDLV